MRFQFLKLISGFLASPFLSIFISGIIIFTYSFLAQYSLCTSSFSLFGKWFKHLRQKTFDFSSFATCFDNSLLKLFIEQ